MHPWPLQGAAAQRFPSLARWRLNRSFHSVSPVFLRQATHHPGEAQDARGIQRFGILNIFPTPYLRPVKKSVGLRTVDVMCRASAQELLARCLARPLPLEKGESNRCEDQLHQWLCKDSGAFADSASFPLYLPHTWIPLPLS
ncbi:germinal-center associated nuclear protein-like [Felis catus]|uniref:germinal-center associated nuclear protein-like n=1 Tax=Felis catus TaxID=9685 RepID=UPI001D19CB0F|nr:germinal-center associated nuclear protein-like [Felis catus]